MSEFSTSDSDSDAVEAASDDRLQYRVGEQTGTAVMLMDSGGVPRENNRVFPFGETWLAFEGSNNSEKFTTYQHDNDAQSDLDYAMARYLASRSGRFMTADPGHVGANVGDPQSWNAYAYAGNDPINFVDPDGLEKKCPKKEGEYSICVEVESTFIPWSGGGFDFGWSPSFADWTKSLSKYWDALFEQGFMDDLKRRSLGGVVNYLDDHRRDTRGLSPFPTTKGELGVSLAMGPFAGVGKSVLLKTGVGTIDTSLVRFTQSSVSQTLRTGENLNDVVRTLRGPGGDALASSFEPIRLFRGAGGDLLTLDNRRLLIFSQAGREVPYVWATSREVAAEAWKFTATAEQAGGWLIRVK